MGITLVCRLLRFGKGVLKLEHVYLKSSTALPLEDITVSLEVTRCKGESASQAEQYVAEIGQSLVFAGIGPEEKSNVLSGLGSIAV